MCSRSHLSNAGGRKSRRVIERSDGTDDPFFLRATAELFKWNPCTRGSVPSLDVKLYRYSKNRMSGRQSNGFSIRYSTREKNVLKGIFFFFFRIGDRKMMRLHYVNLFVSRELMQLKLILIN